MVEVGSVSVVITGLGPDFTKMESFGKVDEFAETLVCAFLFLFAFLIHTLHITCYILIFFFLFVFLLRITYTTLYFILISLIY